MSHSFAGLLQSQKVQTIQIQQTEAFHDYLLKDFATAINKSFEILFLKFGAMCSNSISVFTFKRNTAGTGKKIIHAIRTFSFSLIIF
jgi:hypothetical protein